MNTPPSLPGNAQDRRGLIPGKWVLIVSALVLVTSVPLLTWATLRWVESRQPLLEPLDYTQRESWHAGPLRHVDLSNTGFLQPPGSASYRRIPFNPDPAQTRVIHTLNNLLLADDLAGVSQRLGSDASLVRWLRDAMAMEGFYPSYMLARASALAPPSPQMSQDDMQALRDTALIHAFAAAPKALVLRFVDGQGRAVADRPVGTLAIVCAQTRDGQLDESLRLIYPGLKTDHQGRVYLPVYDAPLRLSIAPDAPAAAWRWPDDILTWFNYPGQAGLMNPVVVD